ncbi:MAG TPA: carbohydrate-binding family 9-like protein [Bryobacteraceae bacterium]|nr:carbohydrate-binding family 9-like protein [Bryobacteraceae bacterium]
MTPKKVLLLSGWLACSVLYAQERCTVAPARSTYLVPHVGAPGELNADPSSPTWSHAASTWIVQDCSTVTAYPKLKTEVKALWTDTDLYLLFLCPYDTLNMFLPSDNSKARLKLWDRDVVEVFLGDDWDNIRHYREFEIAPTGDWIDLAIDLDKKHADRSWRSGWRTTARVDEKAHIWYAAAKIPLRSVSSSAVKAGTAWRMNLYRIEGQGADPQRHFLCWQPTCVVNRDPNHVPENFGALIFTR